MATRYNYTGGIVTDGLVLHLDAAKRDSYPGSGTTWYDLSGNGNNGTVYNGPLYSGISKDSSIDFDGADDYVDCGDIIEGLTAFTAESWINTTDTRTGPNGSYHNPSIFGTQHGSGTSGDFALCLKAGNLGFYHELNGSSQYRDTNTEVSDGNWHHVAATKTTDGTIEVYLDGSSIYSATGFTYALRYRSQLNYNWEVGRAYWPNEDANMRRYDGKIATHMLYNRALTASEITQNYNALKGRYGL